MISATARCLRSSKREKIRAPRFTDFISSANRSARKKDARRRGADEEQSGARRRASRICRRSRERCDPRDPLVREFGSRRSKQRRATRIFAIWPPTPCGKRGEATNLPEKNPPDGARPEDVAKELFAAYDRVRLQEVYELLEGEKSAARKARRRSRRFRQGAARQPMLDRRAETVSGYVAYAQSLEEKDPAAAREASTALRIDPDNRVRPSCARGDFILEGSGVESAESRIRIFSPRARRGSRA